ncbi:MAG: hypothetical protein C4344_01940 [Acidimicrobiia bacterium]
MCRRCAARCGCDLPRDRRGPGLARSFLNLFGRLERHEDHWRWIGGPVPPGADAITLGSVVIVRRRAAGSARLMRHELVHVRQWRR